MKSLRLMSVLVIFCLGILSHAQPEASPASKNSEAELNLTTDQVKKIQDIKAKYAQQLKELAAAVCEKRISLHEAFKSSQKGAEFQKELEKKFTQLAEEKAKDKALQFKVAIEIREILNVDQIVKFNEMQSGKDKNRILQCAASKVNQQ